MPSDRELEAVAKALVDHGGCSGGCSDRPCEVDYKDAEAILSAAATARPDVDWERAARHLVEELRDIAEHPEDAHQSAVVALNWFERASLGEGEGGR